MADHEYESWWGRNGLLTREKMSFSAASQAEKYFPLHSKAESTTLGVFCPVSSTFEEFFLALFTIGCAFSRSLQRCVYRRNRSCRSWEIALWSQGTPLKIWRTTFTVRIKRVYKVPSFNNYFPRGSNTSHSFSLSTESLRLRAFPLFYLLHLFFFQFSQLPIFSAAFDNQ